MEDRKNTVEGREKILANQKAEKISWLRINGKAPDSILPKCKEGRVYYLWYYDDIGDIPDASKVKIEFVEPDEANP